MTGYGAGAAEARGARVTVEMRGLNQRFLDVKVAVPREYAAWETEIRDRVRKTAQRGRVEVTVMRAPIAAERRYRVAMQPGLARAYVGAVRELVQTLRLTGGPSLGDVLRLPGLFEVTEETPDLGGERTALRRALGAALRAFDGERRREGAHLERDMRRRTTQMRALTARIRRRLPEALAALHRQVEERLVRLVGGKELDANRIAHEVAMLAERGDITEEIVRLESHLAALASALGEQGPVGKRIDFLVQEVHRELNTTGAKAGDLTITDLVLAAKGELEKLREQVQNVE